MSNTVTPYQIPPYPNAKPLTLAEIAKVAESLSLKACHADGYPEAVCLVHGIEVPARYEILRSGECIVQAVKLNGFWIDPAGVFTDSAIRCMEADCIILERDLAAA